MLFKYVFVVFYIIIERRTFHKMLRSPTLPLPPTMYSESTATSGAAGLVSMNAVTLTYVADY